MPIAALIRVHGLSTIIGLVFGGILLLSGSACSIPLLNASASGDTTRVLHLLEAGHNVNEAFPIVGTRPLMLAGAYGHAETVAALLDAGADIQASDLTGWTALHAAAFSGDYATVSLLLQRGAEAGKPRWYLTSPADIARMLGHTKIVSILQKGELPPDNQAPSSPEHNSSP